MKTLLKSLLICTVVSIAALADQVAVTSFKYLNSNDNSTIIDPNEAQDLLNVDISPSGKSVKKREGYGLYKTLTSTSTGIHGGYHAFDSSGNDVQIWGSSVSVFGVVGDGDPRTIVSSMTVNSTIDCTDTQGSIYCVNSNRDFFIRTDGTTLTQWYTTPLGTMIESTPDRVVVAGVAASPNTLFISQSNTFTNYTTGANPTDAFTEVIAAPGSHLTHIRWGCQKLLFWKEQSFGYFDFDDQFTAQVKIVSDIIGTLDNTSAIDPGGNVWFRGQDGHTYKYDCSGLEKETIDISPQVQSSGRRTTSLWTQTTSADFAAGGLSSTTVNNNTVILSTGIVDVVSNNSFELGTIPPSNWTYQDVAGIGNFSTSPSGTSCSCSYSAFNGTSVSGFSANKNQVFTANITNVDVSSTILKTTSIDNVASCAWSTYTLTMDGATAGRTVKVMLRVIGVNSIGAATDFRAYSDPFVMTSDIRVRGLSYSFNSASTCDQKSVVFDYITGGSNTVTTGSYYSDVHNAPNLSSWSTFQATDNTISGGGVISYFTRSSTNSFTVLSATPAWISQTNGAIVAASTGTYFQMGSTFTITVATQTPTLNDFTFNWNEGNAADQAYMLYFDNAIFESVPYGVGISSNNYVFRYDLINNGWGLYGFGDGGMIVQRNKLYFGDTSTGNIYKFGDGATSDNGNPVVAYWKSKDFTAADPFMQSALTNVDIFAKKNQGSTLTSTYTLDTTTSTDYTVSLSTANSFIQSRKLLPAGKLGYTFNLKVGDSATSNQWEVFGFRMTYTTNPYRPTP